MSTTQQTFDEAVQEFIERTDQMLEQEVHENFPPPAPAPYPQSVPVQSPLMFDSETIRNYAYTIGDDNPLYTDPEYGRHSIYGTQQFQGFKLPVEF